MLSAAKHRAPRVVMLNGAQHRAQRVVMLSAAKHLAERSIFAAQHRAQRVVMLSGAKHLAQRSIVRSAASCAAKHLPSDGITILRAAQDARRSGYASAQDDIRRMEVFRPSCTSTLTRLPLERDVEGA